MKKALKSPARNLPRFTVAEVRRRFADSVEIRDAKAFAAALSQFLQDKMESVEQVPYMGDSVDRETAAQALARKASALRADVRWQPGKTDIQRGRAALLEVYERSHNLALSDFAQLANKSRQQIYKDIDTHRLLALNVGPRGQKLPDWQLDPVKQQLTQTVLQGAPGVDHWTLYHALAEPLEGLSGRAPVDAVTTDSMDAVVMAVFNVLGVQRDRSKYPVTFAAN